MHIGLIGGIGPSATISYYSRLVESFRTADIALKLTIDHADMSVLLRNALKDQRTAQAEVFSKHLENLAAAGCDIALITALTGHFCFAETRRIAAMELLDGTGVVDKYCLKNGIKTLGLLGSTSVLETRLFGLLHASELVVPQSGLADIGKTYLELAQTGVCTAEQRSTFFEAGESMVKEQNAEAILLAGTDLGLAFDRQAPGFRVIDVIRLHVDELVSLAATQAV